MRVAVIPARGGSKRIPRKNIRAFHGKPIIAWSIEAALESGCFERVLVSTDDAEIAEVAREYGAETPFLRPASIADDFAPTAAVVKHALDWCAAEGIETDHCCCIYATAPFIEPEDISAGLKRLIAGGTDYAMTVTAFPSPIQRAYRIRAGQLEMIDPDQYLVRSQDLEEAYHDAGQFYWGKSKAWREERAISVNSTPIILPQHKVQDIDTPEDWRRAEMMMDYIVLSRREPRDGL
jgi:pseudaminic acid cytidylyltransferase